MPEDSSSTSGLSFSDPRVAIRARDAIRRIAQNTVEIAGSNPNVGRVMSVDIARLKASVWFTGDDSPIEVGLFPGSIPLDLGDYRGTTIVETSTIGTGGLVYVENFRGQPFITKILSGGEYTLNQRVAGLTHQTFNATPLGTKSGAPIGGVYERHVNIKVATDSSFTVGKCMLVGPWSGQNDGSMIDGIVEMVLTNIVSGNVRSACRKYQFSISDAMVVDLEGDEGNKPFWMRVLPETVLSTNPHAELAVDVALVKTRIRSTLEFWIRLVPLDTWADQSDYTMSVKTYGSAFNVGDPNTGRMVTITYPTVDPVQGWLGFHNAAHGWVERDEDPTFPRGIAYYDSEWSTGPWRAAPLRTAKDLLPLWRPDGQWFWGTDHKLSWEGNIIFTGIGPNWNGLHTGSLVVPYPTGNIAVFPAAIATYRSPSGGILLNPGETLYYGICPGVGGQMNWGSANNRFFIVDSKTYNASQKSYALPEWAVPIATRTNTENTERREVIFTSAIVQEDIDDRTKYTEVAYTGTLSPINGSTETALATTFSFRFKKKTAYEVFFKGGMNSATVTQVVNFRWRKGTTVAGANIGEFFRIPIINTTGVLQCTGISYMINDTNADIVTEITLTGQSSGAAGTTNWTRYGSAVDPFVFRLTEVGQSSKYASWPNLT